MKRREFPRAVRVEVVKRSTRGGIVYCEKCGLPAKKFQIDHIIADAHGGEPVIGNAELICETCYSVKNPKDTTIAAKLKRQEAKHLGAKTEPKVKLQSRGFAKRDKAPLIEKQTPPRRSIYGDER
jgi:5-methylcytosine-specific restriction endonuclease McrA